jgi:hypothetical protein
VELAVLLSVKGSYVLGKIKNQRYFEGAKC